MPLARYVRRQAIERIIKPILLDLGFIQPRATCRSGIELIDDENRILRRYKSIAVDVEQHVRVVGCCRRQVIPRRLIQDVDHEHRIDGGNGTIAIDIERIERILLGKIRGFCFSLWDWRTRASARGGSACDATRRRSFFVDARAIPVARDRSP